MRMTAIQLGLVAVLAIPVLAMPAAAQAQLVLKASHQFPGGKGDVRDDMVQIIAKQAKAANVGLDMQVYPGRLAVQAKPAVERPRRRPARRFVVSARLRQRQSAD